MVSTMVPMPPRILVVDDEPRAVELLVRTLRRQADVEAALSGDEAWTIFQGGGFSLVISDQRMPGMTGIELLGRVADEDESTGRILLTGFSDLEATVEAINRGRVHAYLHKPCAPPELIATTRGVLDRVVLSRENAALLADLRERNEQLGEAQSELESAHTRVVASERLAAIGKAIAMIVHDLRSPLTILMGIGSQLDELAMGNEQLGELRDELSAEVTRVQRMCEGLLDVTRASDGSGRKTLESLDEVVAAAIAPLVEAASLQGIEVKIELASGIELALDEPSIQRALRNLLTNSLEAMVDGGALVLSTAVEEATAVIRVSDNGTGIPSEIADRLFEPFVTSGKHGGTGLGLAIVQKVVHDHDGTIAVDKPVGGGTTFVLRLPIRGET